MLTFSNVNIFVVYRMTSFYEGLVSSWMPWKWLANVESMVRWTATFSS